MKGRRGKKQMTSSSTNTAIKDEADSVKQVQCSITSYFSPNNLKNVRIRDSRGVKKKVSENNDTDGEVKENIGCQSSDNLNSSEQVDPKEKTSAGNEVKKPPPRQKKTVENDHTYCKEKAGPNVPPVLKSTESSKTKKDAKAVNNKQITEFFPIRRSDRKTKKQLQIEKQDQIKGILLSETDPSHLHICEFEGKGRGVITSKFFKRGDFVVEYSGELIDPEMAKRRELQYSSDDNIGCYMYYFSHNDKQYCVDATIETGRLGRLINHSKKDGNLITKTFVVNKGPRLILIAKRDIFEEEELLYDYGDRSNASLQNHPWLAE